ncbi:hypothetical protein HOD30_03250 [Candidatus Peregrinibacteria bacterium]|jgi:vacuolar-type H+-ATPase subunit E/Vma4|nr:hypothetical protein [Candidatus Peregrinibacteria bacterium]MBT4631676.1 hypothetical protein [Candidatus Peregrinibacteria bacterium]MBT5517026.1 hypothetical protein [Candidatus Peregrinibacteria bacterium]MBT5823914.1 hypothetical protein [Candidatus Peregrinibacteria bacterium]
MSTQNIINQIENDAEAEVKKLGEARDQAIYKIQKDYEQKREKSTEKISAKLADSIAKVEGRAETFTNMEVRNDLLRGKHAVLTAAFDQTIANLFASKDYEKILVKLLKKASKEFKEGTVVPAKGKEDETKKALKESGADFELAGRSAHIKGGFILKTPSVELDFSFESILGKELWGDLETELSQLLFN